MDPTSLSYSFYHLISHQDVPANLRNARNATDSTLYVDDAISVLTLVPIFSINLCNKIDEHLVVCVDVKNVFC